MPLRKPAKKSSNTASRISKARLAAMIEEATVDAYGESEEITGWYTVLEEHLALARIEYEEERSAHARPTFADCAARYVAHCCEW